MNSIYGEGNYWYRGQAPGTWSGGEAFYGGGGNYYSRIVTASDINSLLNSSYGGYWSTYSGTTYFKSDIEAFIAGCIINEMYNYWSSTTPGSLSAAIKSYENILSLRYLPPPLDGIGSAQSGGNISPDGLIRYVNTNFGKRLPNNVSIKWLVWDKEFGLTRTANILNKNANLTVSIPRGFLNDPKGFLYDCVDHEIVHVNDFASGRALNWFIMYDWPVTEAIMDYRAYSRNQWYSNTYRNGYYDYSSHIKRALYLLPPGWK